MDTKKTSHPPLAPCLHHSRRKSFLTKPECPNGRHRFCLNSLFRIKSEYLDFYWTIIILSNIYWQSCIVQISDRLYEFYKSKQKTRHQFPEPTMQTFFCDIFRSVVIRSLFETIYTKFPLNPISFRWSLELKTTGSKGQQLHRVPRKTAL